ncbi:MAG: hypothetical protein COV79_02405 [Parcubacteria group bacterium CG11_big_fil_rev_8_21_14_0_20_41_14]|nr:MAG: hypothetical protein COW93_02425 [Parcubacteria group bacterium CG22_combo_CG10-13_8_21_14_all_41_9]PIQ80078.1 MAG: hypothetical protein COV79_02405 [Parcubacteria group bacterium CG11_big_fil_rev_8_21_14_0_20_41_14]PIR57110.1 MAG: hypothetical protein COU72_02645 [Parcubacteria group bacterium CG10_big_fil_rev_8_21_14_0_10_41_35]
MKTRKIVSPKEIQELGYSNISAQDTVVFFLNNPLFPQISILRINATQDIHEDFLNGRGVSEDRQMLLLFYDYPSTDALVRQLSYERKEWIQNRYEMIIARRSFFEELADTNNPLMFLKRRNYDERIWDKGTYGISNDDLLNLWIRELCHQFSSTGYIACKFSSRFKSMLQESDRDTFEIYNECKRSSLEIPNWIVGGGNPFVRLTFSETHGALPKSFQNEIISEVSSFFKAIIES